MAVHWTGLVVAVMLLAASWPLVARLRHPAQKPIAAWLVFLLTFGASAFALFNLLAWLATRLAFADALARPLPAALFLLLVFAPALALGAWQARKPPSRRGPPD